VYCGVEVGVFGVFWCDTGYFLSVRSLLCCVYQCRETLRCSLDTQSSSVLPLRMYVPNVAQNATSLHTFYIRIQAPPALQHTPQTPKKCVLVCVCVFVTCCVTSGTTSETRGSAHHWRKIGRDMTSVGAGCCQCRNYCRPLYYVEHGWRHDTSYLTVFGRRRTISGISPMTCRTDV
jgi:hypothetical protein